MNTTDQPGQAPTNDTLPAEQLKQAVERMARTLEYCKQPPANQLASVFTSDLRLVLSRLAELERDRERLDWLDRLGVWSAKSDTKTWKFQLPGYPGTESSLRMDIRMSLDAAMSAAAMTTQNTKGEAE